MTAFSLWLLAIEREKRDDRLAIGKQSDLPPCAPYIASSMAVGSMNLDTEYAVEKHEEQVMEEQRFNPALVADEQPADRDALLLRDEDETTTGQTMRQQRRLRIAVVVVGAIIVTFVVVDAMTAKRLEHACARFVEWVALHPLLGVFAVILVYMLATVCFVPGSILTVGTGYAFGRAFSSTFVAVLLSALSVFLGASLGSLCCLFLGRYLFRQPVMQLAESYPIFRAIDRALEGNGFKIMLLLRLSPLIPYNALDYISGITSISIKDYSLALTGLLPGAFTLCYVGATASSLAEGTSKASEDKGLRTAIMVFGLFFAFAGFFVASYYSKIELDRILNQDEDIEPGGLLSNDGEPDGGQRQQNNEYRDIHEEVDHELT